MECNIYLLFNLFFNSDSIEKGKEEYACRSAERFVMNTEESIGNGSIRWNYNSTLSNLHELFFSNYESLKKMAQISNINGKKLIQFKCLKENIDDAKFAVKKSQAQVCTATSNANSLNEHFAFLQKITIKLSNLLSESNQRNEDLTKSIEKLISRKSKNNGNSELLQKIEILESHLRDSEIKTFRIQKSNEYKDQEISQLRDRLRKREKLPISSITEARENFETDSGYKCNGKCQYSEESNSLRNEVERLTQLLGSSQGNDIKIDTLKFDKRELQSRFKKEYIGLLKEIESLHCQIISQQIQQTDLTTEFSNSSKRIKELELMIGSLNLQKENSMNFNSGFDATPSKPSPIDSSFHNFIDRLEYPDSLFESENHIQECKSRDSINLSKNPTPLITQPSQRKSINLNFNKSNIDSRIPKTGNLGSKNKYKY